MTKTQSTTDLIEVSLDTVRMDAETGLGSVIDLVRLLTGGTATPSEASAAFRRLLDRAPELKDRVVTKRINGLGRATPCATSENLIHIGMLLTGKGADQVRAMAACSKSRQKRDSNATGRGGEHRKRKSRRKSRAV